MLREMNLEPKALIEPIDNLYKNSAKKVARGANTFAFKFSAALVKNSGYENFICSPFSIWLPLAALANAADKKIRKKLISAIGASGIETDIINCAVSRMLFDLTKLRDIQGVIEHNEIAVEHGLELLKHHNPLKIVNAIFVSNDMTIKEKFAQTFINNYRGNTINVDFNSDETVRAVNQWASDNTNEMIKEIVRKFDPLTVATIGNAIYYSDRWMWELERSDTKEDVFFSPNKTSHAYYMLREGDEQIYYEDKNIQAIQLDFKTGGELLIVLPKNGNATGLLSSMTSEYFNRILNSAWCSSGRLLLPRFSIESKIMALEGTLTSLGVPIFGDGNTSHINNLIEEDIPIRFSSTVQKAVINVDEDGTTAAAVTVAVYYTGIPRSTEPFEMICNKPFVFILSDYTYDGEKQVLFTGVVNQP